jgi:endonuclease YncB( thermonuclease family)
VGGFLRGRFFAVLFFSLFNTKFNIMMKLILGFLLFFSLNFVSFSQSAINGRVVSVLDGDTFIILDKQNNQTHIRFYGIDCPEKKQAFGQIAKKLTSDLSFKKWVTVIVKGKDIYGRTIGIVKLPDGKILNEELLRSGLAWHYTKFDNSASYASLQALGIQI